MINREKLNNIKQMKTLTNIKCTFLKKSKPVFLSVCAIIFFCKSSGVMVQKIVQPVTKKPKVANIAENKNETSSFILV